MDDFIKSVDTPEEAINIFRQFQPVLSKPGFELKKWTSNCNKVTEENPEDLISISDTKLVEGEPNKVGLSVLGLQWNVTKDISQVCRDTSKKVENPNTQSKIVP